MDPISITGTLLTIIQIGVTIYGGLKGIDDVPIAIGNVTYEIEALRPILVSLKDYLDHGSLSHFPESLRKSLFENLENLKDVKMQIYEILKDYLNNPQGARWAKLKRNFSWSVLKEKDMDRLRSYLTGHKATLQLTFAIIQQLEMGRASQKQEENHAAVITQLAEIKRGLQTKDEPSKTSSVQLDSSKTKTYLDSLAEFVTSQFERSIISGRSYSPAISNNSTTNDNTHSTPTPHPGLPATVGTIASTMAAAPLFLTAVAANRFLNLLRSPREIESNPQPPNRLVSGPNQGTMQVYHREPDNQTRWPPPANPPGDLSRPPFMLHTAPVQPWEQYHPPSRIHTQESNPNTTMVALPAYTPTIYHPPPVQSREYCPQPQYIGSSGASYSPPPPPPPPYPTTPRTMHYTYGQNPNHVPQNYQPEYNVPRQTQWMNNLPPAGTYYPPPPMNAPISFM